MPGYVVLIYLVELAANVGVGRATDALAVSAVGVISVVGRNVDGVATDWFGRGHLAAACAVVNEATTTGLMVVGGPTKILPLSVVFGVGYGGIGSLVSPGLAELFGTDDLYALFALTSRSFAIAGSVAPYLSGAGYEVLGRSSPSS